MWKNSNSKGYKSKTVKINKLKKSVTHQHFCHYKKMRQFKNQKGQNSKTQIDTKLNFLQNLISKEKKTN